jgi:hypothetical protein
MGSDAGSDCAWSLYDLCDVSPAVKKKVRKGMPESMKGAFSSFEKKKTFHGRYRSTGAGKSDDQL